MQRSSEYKPLLFLFCVFMLICTTPLVLTLGGYTTSIKAGMAFLDWPLSNGSINPEGWLKEADKFAEHSHRLLASLAGLLSIGLCLWTWLREERGWIRRLSRILLLVIILQGVLGGARVRFDQLNLLTENNLLAQTFAVTHASGAMVVLCLLAAITLAYSRLWIEQYEKLPAPKAVKSWGIAATAMIFIQILIGAIMRHADAGLAIAKFPLASAGSLLPAYWNFDVAIHFAHRVGAVLILFVLGYYLFLLCSAKGKIGVYKWSMVLIAVLLIVQIALGAFTIWTVKNPYVATAHHLIGAFLLASTWALTFLTHHAADQSSQKS